jgi:hypothetical protein
MFHDAEPRHIEADGKGAEALPVLVKQAVEQDPPGGIAERFEDRFHT